LTSCMASGRQAGDWRGLDRPEAAALHAREQWNRSYCCKLVEPRCSRHGPEVDVYDGWDPIFHVKRNGASLAYSILRCHVPNRVAAAFDYLDIYYFSVRLGGNLDFYRWIAFNWFSWCNVWLNCFSYFLGIGLRHLSLKSKTIRGRYTTINTLSRGCFGRLEF